MVLGKIKSILASRKERKQKEKELVERLRQKYGIPRAFAQDLARGLLSGTLEPHDINELVREYKEEKKKRVKEAIRSKIRGTARQGSRAERLATASARLVSLLGGFGFYEEPRRRSSRRGRRKKRSKRRRRGR